jgi:hypothetical protein
MLKLAQFCMLWITTQLMARTLEAQVRLNDEGDARVLDPARELVKLQAAKQAS